MWCNISIFKSKVEKEEEKRDKIIDIIDSLEENIKTLEIKYKALGCTINDLKDKARNLKKNNEPSLRSVLQDIAIKQIEFNNYMKLYLMNTKTVSSIRILWSSKVNANILISNIKEINMLADRTTGIQVDSLSDSLEKIDNVISDLGSSLSEVANGFDMTNDEYMYDDIEDFYKNVMNIKTETDEKNEEKEERAYSDIINQEENKYKRKNVDRSKEVNQEERKKKTTILIEKKKELTE
jgi:hypothetical protein